MPQLHLPLFPSGATEITSALSCGRTDDSFEQPLVHCRRDATTLGCVTHRGVGLVEGVLPNQAQQVHRQDMANLTFKVNAIHTLSH